MNFGFTRLGAISGLLYVALTNASIFTAQWPDLDSNRTDVAHYLATHSSGTTWAAALLAIFAALAFVGFAAALSQQLQSWNGESQIPLGMITGAALVAAAGTLVATGGLVALTYRLPAHPSIDVARLVFDTGTVLFFLSLIPAALVPATAGLVAARSRARPRWWAWSAIGVAALLLAAIGMLTSTRSPSHLAAMLFELWIAATSVLLFRGRIGLGATSRATVTDP